MPMTDPNIACTSSTLLKNGSNYDGEKSRLQTIKLDLGGELVDIPKVLVEDISLLRGVLNKDTFAKLSSRTQEHLKTFLPISQSKPSSSKELDEALECAFTEDEQFNFGNPISKFFKKIQGGQLSLPEAARYSQLRDIRRVLYDHYIRNYNMKLLKRLLINRHKILDAASTTNPCEKLQINQKNFFSKRKLIKSAEIRQRARLRARRMITHCKKQVEPTEAAASSDDSDFDINENEIPQSSSVKSTVYSKKFSEADIGLYQPIRIKSLKELLSEYKHLRETEPDCPSLDITDIRIEDVYNRAEISYQSERNFVTKMLSRKNDEEREGLSVKIE